MNLTIGIVSYNQPEKLASLLESLISSEIPVDVTHITVKIFDNSEAAETKEAVQAIIENYQHSQFTFDYIYSSENVGFGTAVNQLEKTLPASIENDWLWVLNQDVELPHHTLAQLFTALSTIDKQVGAVELRQLPYEHPKNYHPSSLETDWISGAAFAVRREAFQQVGGFDERLFLYAEDVDLSWRLRIAGYQLLYLPTLTAYHHSVSVANEVKPTQIIEGTLNNLCLRVQYGNLLDVVVGLLQLLVEILRKPNFAGRRKALLMVYPRFFKRFISFYRSGKSYRKASGLKPTFMGWNFALHRRGAYHPCNGLEKIENGEPPKLPKLPKLPLVSVLIRTQNRPFFLQQAIQSVLNQTYPNIEIVVVEDGINQSQSVIDEFADKRITYHAIGEKTGRSNAGNVALSLAKGEWFNFLDDDDQLYADHIETLLAEVTNSANSQYYGAVYGATFEVITDYQTVSYQEKQYYERYREPYSVFTLLKHNFLPIQSVLFKRQLYDELGGFNDKLDMLEDWNLWVKYGTHLPFLFVDKTTSKYRVPATTSVATKRKAGFLEAFNEVVADQQQLPALNISVKEAQQMLDIYLQSKKQMEAQQKRIHILSMEKGYKRLFYKIICLAKDVVNHCRR